MDLICPMILVPHVKLLQFSCDVICGTRVGVPVHVHVVCMSGSRYSLLVGVVAFIKVVPTLDRCMPFFFTNLTCWTFAAGVARTGAPTSVPSRAPTMEVSSVTIEAAASTRGSVGQRWEHALVLSLKKGLTQFIA
jgi:hypothetical protein